MYIPVSWSHSKDSVVYLGYNIAVNFFMFNIRILSCLRGLFVISLNGKWYNINIRPYFRFINVGLCTTSRNQ